MDKVRLTMFVSSEVAAKLRLLAAERYTTASGIVSMLVLNGELGSTKVVPTLQRVQPDAREQVAEATEQVAEATEQVVEATQPVHNPTTGVVMVDDEARRLAALAKWTRKS